MDFDDFILEIQSDEQNPDEYYNWIRFCAEAYEASEQEAYD